MELELLTGLRRVRRLNQVEHALRVAQLARVRSATARDASAARLGLRRPLRAHERLGGDALRAAALRRTLRSARRVDTGLRGARVEHLLGLRDALDAGGHRRRDGHAGDCARQLARAAAVDGLRGLHCEQLAGQANMRVGALPHLARERLRSRVSTSRRGRARRRS